MDITINGEKESMDEAQSQAPSSDRPMLWTICAFCCARYKSYISLLNKPTRCQSCYLEFFSGKTIGTTGNKANQTTLSSTTMEQLGYIDTQEQASAAKRSTSESSKVFD
ncbi:unnamed protein product [Microthlaspi erraticum]|uniref:Uncharacterized protein n=1 Tax=Microthlaspi erraticum TaxID=1685480 RepID=A0A6D2KY08_9BRAS|nr:unnamed protein product [Microthlaspi erraticum]